MKQLTTSALRQEFLTFFASHQHAIIPGATLVPDNDPTVLFTTAGMHPLVPYLMGEKHPAGTRLADVQLCVRTQDIDEVGDSTHLTCFEMLGNWSLGDYFKREAIEMSFAFIIEQLGIPLSHFAVTCFLGDSDAPKDTESAAIWRGLGVPEERIGYLPKAKNWWGPAGKTGPCGPDTEMFYWVGEGKPVGNPATHENEWMEIWNDVFMQYNKREDGAFEPLAQKNVDTGMGLERVAAVLQGVSNVYETDALARVLHAVLANAPTHDMKSARIVADHIKAATFIIADGVLPSNIDRGYVLRRLIRRAIRSARQLGLQQENGRIAEIAKIVIDTYSEPYPQLKNKNKEIVQSLNTEEEKFNKTLQEGLKHFEKIAQTCGSRLDGTAAFHLYDTYGFPLELTRELAQEKGLSVDEQGFADAFSRHQSLSRTAGEKRFAGGLADQSDETTKLHTATHLLNAALRKVLGEHVMQKGSNITAERLRFDFSHPEKMTPEQLKEVQRLVNDAITADVPVSFSVMTVEEALSQGAIGVFGDKYGEKVKVYTMGDYSKEICGGPHVARTGMLGSFTIQKEESSSSGVRRIKAIVSGGPAEISVAVETSQL